MDIVEIMRVVHNSAAYRLLLFLTLVLFGAFGSVGELQAADECGASSTFSARFSPHSTAPANAYSSGVIVTTGSAATLQLWAWTSAVTTTPAPTTASPRGWVDVTTQYAAMIVDCNSSDTLTAATNISYDDDDLAIIFNRTGSTDTVNTIAHTGVGGEIHLQDGSVSAANAVGSVTAVSIINTTSTDTLRFVMNSGTSVSNADTGSTSRGVFLSGGGSIFMDIAGSVQTTAGTGIYALARGSGDITVDISGGTHTSPRRVLLTGLGSGGTGDTDVDISGSTVLHGGSSSLPVIDINGIAGTDTLDIGSGVVVCRGSYAASTCTQAAGSAIVFERSGSQGGSVAITNAGSIFGNIVTTGFGSLVGTSVRNLTGGVIVGTFTGGGANDALNNAATWTVSGNSDFGGGTGDSFINSGTLIVHYGTSTIAMNNLETFTMASGSTLRFSLGAGAAPSHALLSLSGAAITFAGNLDFTTRDMSAMPTTGTLTILSATSLPGNTDISGLTFSGINGILRIANNQLLMDLARLPISTDCGDSTIISNPQSPSVANMQVICDTSDSIGSSTDVTVTDEKVSIIYRGTQMNGTGNVRSISNTGAGGELHLDSGSVVRPDNGAATAVDAVTLSNTGTDRTYFLMDSDVSVTNTDTTSGSDAVIVTGGGAVVVDITGSTSATAGVAITAQAGGSGGLDLDIKGGTHASPSGTVLSASIATGGTGAIDIDVTGSVVFHGGSSSAAVISVSGIKGADSLVLPSTAVVCRGSYSASVCTQATGTAISFGKTGTQTGSVTLTNAGKIFGDVSLSTVTVSSTVTNQANAEIVGTFTGGAGNSAVSNAGTWTLNGNFDFGSTSDSDSFTNSGTFIVHYSGTALAMNNLESFSLQSGGTLRFSMNTGATPSHALLNIGGASLASLMGTLQFVTRDSSNMPTTGTLTIFSATSIPGATSTAGLTLTGAYGLFRIANNQLLLDLARPPISTTCGSTTIIASPVSPGVANMQALCNSADSLTSATDISISDEKVSIVFRGTQVGGSGKVRSISNTGDGGEIHIESGEVERTDNAANTAVDAVSLAPGSGTETLRLVVGSSADVTNLDVTTGSDAISVVGGGAVSIAIVGDVSASGGNAVYASAGGSGGVDLDITGGVHSSSSASAIIAAISASGTGALDVDITGATTAVHGGSSSHAVISLSGRQGADTLDIGTGVTVCRGTYSGGTCTVGTGQAISIAKVGTQSGSVALANSGNIWGNISFSTLTVDSTFANNANAVVVGTFQGGTGNDVVTNAGTWTMSSSFDFGSKASDADSFTNSGTFIVRYDSTTLAMNNLETFTLQASGTLRFSLGASTPIPTVALLDIGGATPTFAGTVNLVYRDSSVAPISGILKLITGTQISSSTSVSGLSLTGAFGTFSISGNDLIFTYAREPASSICGMSALPEFDPTSPGFANREIICDHSESPALTASSQISVTAPRVKITYRGTASNGTGAVTSISNTGFGGEIYLDSGSVSRSDDGGATTSVDAVVLSSTLTNALHIKTDSDTSVTNLDTTSQSDAIYISGGGNVYLDISGSTSAMGGIALLATTTGGSIDLDVKGSTHTSPTHVISAVLSGGSGNVDVDITGASTVLHGGSASDAVIELSGIGGADTLDIGTGVVVCRGSYSASTCTQASGTAISLVKTSSQAGSVALNNLGSIFGDVSVSTLTVGSTIANAASGTITGAFTGGSNNDVLTNAGTWTISSNFDFAGGTDSFTNSGTFIVHYAGTTLAMNNLETFTLDSGGTLRFSQATDTPIPSIALLDIGGATPTLAGVINMHFRDGSTAPISGIIRLITGTQIVSGTTDISGLSLTGAYGTFSISGNNIILTYARRPANTLCTTSALPEFPHVLPGFANREVICDSADSLTISSNISVGASDPRVKIIYRGTQAGGSGTVRSISNLGFGGEIHIESGSVSHPDTGDATVGDAVTLSASQTQALRLVMASGTSVASLDTTAGSEAIYVSGGGSVFVEIAGSTSAVGGTAISVTAAGSGDADLDITGGTHSTTAASSYAVEAFVASGGTGNIDIDITGASTLLSSSGTSGGVIKLDGRTGADTLDIGTGVVVCRGTYSSGACTSTSGNAIQVGKNSAASGRITVTTAATVSGDISIGSGSFDVTFTNEASGSIDGDFTSGSSGATMITNRGTWTMSSTPNFGSGATQVINEGTWTMPADFTFSSGSADSFTNSGTLIVHYAGSTLAMNNLDTLDLSGGLLSAGTIRISLASNTIPSHAILDIGGAALTLAGAFDFQLRDASAVPISGTIKLITGTQVGSTTVSIHPTKGIIEGLTVTGAVGTFTIVNNDLIFTFARPLATSVCGTSELPERDPNSPGFANRDITCDSADTALNADSVISVTAPRVSLTYRGTQPGGSGTVRSISNTGFGGEIHVLSGTVSRPDDGVPGGNGYVARLVNTDTTDPLRLVVARDTLLRNLDTSTQSHAVYVQGIASVYLEIAGSTSAAGGHAIYARTASAGNINLDVTGGTHTSVRRVVYAQIDTGGTGDVDVDIEGSRTVLSSSSATEPVVLLRGGVGADTVDITSGATICKGLYSSDICSRTPGVAVRFTKPNPIGGSVTLTNAGAIFGDIFIDAGAIAATVTNNGRIFGRLLTASSATGGETVSNAGNWTLFGDSAFGRGNDSFTSTNHLEIHYAGTTVSVSDLETFGSTGTLGFSLPTAVLPSRALFSISEASFALSGQLALSTRDESTLPTAGQLLLMVGTNIDTNLDVTGIGFDPPLSNNDNAQLRLARGKLILSLGDRCGPLTVGEVVAPGVANRFTTCDRGDALTGSTVITNFEDRVALLYRGSTEPEFLPVRSIINDGAGGEIHVFSGAVLTRDDENPNTAHSSLRVGPPVITDSTTLAVMRGALSDAAAEGTQGQPDYLTAPQVFARDNAIRITTASGTIVRNEDESAYQGNNFNAGNHGILASGAGGHVFLDIAGETSARGGSSHAIHAVTSAAGRIILRITGGTHHAVGERSQVIRTRLEPAPFSEDGVYPSGHIDIDITGETRLSVSGDDPAGMQDDNGTAVISMSATWSHSGSPPNAPEDRSSTLDIGEDVVLCRGSFRSGRCVQRGKYALIVSAAGTTLTARSTPGFQIVNEGTIFGSIYSHKNPRGTRITNRGEIMGNFVAGPDDGPDVIVNERSSTWIMTGPSVFGAGTDSFTNRGILVLRYNGETISMSGLETFTQAAGSILRIEIDPRRFGDDLPRCQGAQTPTHNRCELADDDLPNPINPALPTNPIVDFADAQGQVEGFLQVVLLDARNMVGAPSRQELQTLLANLGEETSYSLFMNAGGLTFTGIQLSGGLTRAESGAISYDLGTLPVEGGLQLGDRTENIILGHTVDSVVQASWFATRALLNSLAASECTVENAFSQRAGVLNFLDGSCFWTNIGGRITSHDREGVVQATEEMSLLISAGFQVPLGDLIGLSVSGAYEFIDLDLGTSSGDGDRAVVAVVASTIVSPGIPVNFAIGATANAGRYEVTRKTFDGTVYKGEPQVLVVGGHAGVEYVFAQDMGSRGSLAIVPRLQADLVGMFVDGFNQKNSGFQIEELHEFMASFTPSLELRYSNMGSLGELQSWLQAGFVAFATDPELEYEVSNFPVKGTMERFFLEASAGVNFVWGKRSEFTLFWDGLFGEETISNSISLKAKYSF